MRWGWGGSEVSNGESVIPEPYSDLPNLGVEGFQRLCFNSAMLSRLLKVGLLLSSVALMGQDAAYWHFLSAYAKQQGAQVSGNLDKFTRLTQPYAPLDIQVTGAPIDQAREIKNFFFGIAAASSGIAVDKATAMTNGFHCQGCAESRMGELRKDVQGIRALVDRFNGISRNLLILAQWETPGDFRFNSTFHEGVITQEYTNDQGIFPRSTSKSYPDVSSAMKPIGISEVDVDALLRQMNALHIVALVRTGEGVRAIRAGVTRSEAGLLFLTPGVARPETA